MSQQLALEPAQDDPGQRDVPWTRVDVRTALGRPLDHLTRLAPFFLTAIVFGEHWWMIVMNALAGALFICDGLSAWLTTFYRVTDEHLEVRRGFIYRKHLKVPRARIRAIELTSSYVYRMLRIVRVRVGTGEHQGVTLTAVSRAEGRRLRKQLLRRPLAHSPTKPQAQAEPLASFQPRWLCYALLSLSGITAVTTVFGLLFSVVGHLDSNELVSAANTTKNWVSSQGLWITAALLSMTVLVILMIGSLGIYLLRYWKFTLDQTGDQLQVTRGLLTTFYRAIPAHRLRGFEMIEKLPLRVARGAEFNALTTGLGAAGDRVILLPAGPLSTIRSVSAQVLGTDATPLAVPLEHHPPAALRRRLVRVVGPAVVVASMVTYWAGPGPWLWIWVLLPLSIALGWDRYRSLGNAMTNSHLVSRSGSLYRHTVALEREGILGWHMKQSWSQRRAGLMTVAAITAAGRGAYGVIDVADKHGVEQAARAVPGLLDDIAVNSQIPRSSGS